MKQTKLINYSRWFLVLYFKSIEAEESHISRKRISSMYVLHVVELLSAADACFMAMLNYLSCLILIYFRKFFKYLYMMLLSVLINILTICPSTPTPTPTPRFLPFFILIYLAFSFRPVLNELPALKGLCKAPYCPSVAMS